MFDYANQAGAAVLRSGRQDSAENPGTPVVNRSSLTLSYVYVYADDRDRRSQRILTHELEALGREGGWLMGSL